MRRYVQYATLIVVLAILPSIGCAGPGQITASLGQQFTLGAGQMAAITGDNLSIRFIEVITDSRCPSNVVCIWQGEVSCLTEITKTGAPPYRVVLTQPGLSGESAKQAFDGYQVSFKVEPYPVAGQAIPKDKYQLVLTVIKAGAR